MTAELDESKQGNTPRPTDADENLKVGHELVFPSPVAPPPPRYSQVELKHVYPPKAAALNSVQAPALKQPDNNSKLLSSPCLM